MHTMKHFLFCVLIFCATASIKCEESTVKKTFKAINPEASKSEATMSNGTTNTLSLLDNMAANNEIPNLEAEHKAKFYQFIKDFGKVYETKEEVAKRYAIFVENLSNIEKLNTGDHGTARYGVNKFADLSKEEMQSNFGLHIKKTKQ